jgi:hypothetical protein
MAIFYGYGASPYLLSLTRRMAGMDHSDLSLLRKIVLVLFAVLPLWLETEKDNNYVRGAPQN